MLRGVTVVKVGGEELEPGGGLPALARALARMAPLVVVHGGGREVSALQAGLGLAPRWRDGLRVTDERTLAAVSMVLNGVVNKRVVAALVGAGVRAAGVCGEDDGLLRAEPLAGGALGRTGAVVAVDPALLLLFLGAGITPVVSPVSRGPDGGALNVNADDAAVALAAALRAERLLFISDVPGVRLAEGVASELAGDGVEAAIASGAVTAGMAPKVRAAARAAAAGIRDVRIGSTALLEGGAGTRVVAGAERAA